MKKNLRNLVTRLSEDPEGTMQGGFGSIRGGRESVFSTNSAETCTNSRCTGTNENICTNEVDCTGATNKSTKCSNKSYCFADGLS
jgi:hypothetical protein